MLMLKMSALKLLTMTNLHLLTQLMKPNYPERISDRLTE